MPGKQLTILHSNKFHYFRGGAETVYLNTARIMESYGHRSVFFSMHHPQNLPCDTKDYFLPYVELNTNGHSVKNQMKTAGRILYSFEAKRLLSQLLDQYPVDIAHLHNIYHHISPSILSVLRKRKIPVVMTLHDYKMVCASYHLLLDHIKPCEACRGGRYFMAIQNRCVKKSLVKTLLSTMEMYFHHKALDIYDMVDIFIAPSRFLKDKLFDMGFRKEMWYLPNYIDSEKFQVFKGDAQDENNEKSVVYFGRLSPEKGLITLLEAIKMLRSRGMNNIAFKIIGDGPMRTFLESKVQGQGLHGIRLLGYKAGEELKDEIRKSLFAVLPSRCYENNPMSVIEAFALGKPVIGSRIGGIPELVKDNVTGLTFEPGNADDLRSGIEYLISHPARTGEMGKNARMFVEQELNARKYYEGLMEIYERALHHNKHKRQ
ncbi:MAG: glycosyltransferase family 4 protein [Candidatus Brocadia sp.]